MYVDLFVLSLVSVFVCSFLMCMLLECRSSVPYVGVYVWCIVCCFVGAGSSVVERSIAARRVAGSSPVSRSFCFCSHLLHIIFVHFVAILLCSARARIFDTISLRALLARVTMRFNALVEVRHFFFISRTLGLPRHFLTHSFSLSF